MSNWTLRPLGSLLRASFPGEWGSEPDATGALANVFRGADFVQSGKLERTGGAPRRIALSKLRRLQLQPGDVLLEKSGGSPDQPVGRVSYFEGAAGAAVASNFLQTLRPSGDVHPKFVFYVLQNEYARGRVLPFQQQTTGLINFRLRDYLREEVCIPDSLDEQRRVAALLSAADAQIESLEAQVEKEAKLMQGLLQALLPEGFDVSKLPTNYLGNALHGIEGGKSFMCSDTPASEGAWGVLKVSAVRPDGFASIENKLVENLALVNPRYEVREGDLLITRANTPELVGAACYVKSPQRRLLLCDKTLRLLPKSEALPQYLWLWLQTPVARRHVEAHATGTSAGMKNISQGSIRRIPLALPAPKEQQRRLAPIIAQLDYVNVLRTEAEKERRKKFGLLYALLESAEH